MRKYLTSNPEWATYWRVPTLQYFLADIQSQGWQVKRTEFNISHDISPHEELFTSEESIPAVNMMGMEISARFQDSHPVQSYTSSEMGTVPQGPELRHSAHVHLKPA